MVVAYATVDLQELKARHPLGDAVEAAGVALRGKGRVRQGVCPFHQEVEGSFTVYADSEKFYCFGCGAGGDVLDFVQRTEGLTLPEAIRRMDDGPRMVAAPRPQPASTQRPAAPALPPRDPALLTAAARFYAGQLRRSPRAREYLASRGLGLEAALHLGLGYATGRGLRDALESAGFTGQRLRESGLFLERGAERFVGMIAVPDTTSGRVRWLTGRAVDAGAAPRFQAVPGPKPVLGLARLGPAPAWAIVAEGVFDYLVLAAWGYPRVFLAFDNDGAGATAAEDLKQLLGRRAAGVNLPDGVADVGELAALPYGQPLFRRAAWSTFLMASPMWANWRRCPTDNPCSAACWHGPHGPPGNTPPPHTSSPSPYRSSVPHHYQSNTLEDLRPFPDGASPRPRLPLRGSRITCHPQHNDRQRRYIMSLSHRPVGELTNTGVGAMGLKRGRPVQFHWPLVGPQKGRLPLLVPWGLGPAPRGLATAP